MQRRVSLKFELFSIEVNLVDNSPSTWRLDSGSLIHIDNTLQGFLSKRALKRSEVNVSIGNGTGVAVKAIGTVRVVLGSGLPFDLDNVCLLYSSLYAEEFGFNFLFG